MRERKDKDKDKDTGRAGLDDDPTEALRPPQRRRDASSDDATEALRPPQRRQGQAVDDGPAPAPAPRLPRVDALGAFERACALLGASRFLAQLDGAAVLVRLDERGGHDEAAPWAFPSRDALDAAAEAQSEDDDNIFIDPVFTADSDEATATGPAQPPLMTPPARHHATVYVVPHGGGRVGRSPKSGIRVDVRSVSRQHALIGVDDNGDFSLLDLDSHNGSGVNGMELVPGAPQALRSGDVVSLGDTRFLFLDAAGFISHLPALVA